MGYGKIKPNIHAEGIIQRRKAESEKREIKKEDLTLPELTEEEFIEEVNIKATTIYYEENSNAIPPDGFDEKKKISQRDEKRLEGYTIINQSLIKKLVDKYQNEIDFCPRYIKECCMERKHKETSTNPQLAGKFFESMTLGGTTHGAPVTDLPRKKLTKKRIAELKAAGLPLIGEKRIDQERLEIQIERFKKRAEQLNVQIIPGVNTHLQIFKHWDGRKYILAGELDLFPTPILHDGKLQLAIIDVKVTSNVETTFGPFCWGSPQFMDHLQADMYHLLVRNIDFDLNPHLKNVVNENILHNLNNDNVIFLYWVWGYQKEPLELQEKIIERSYFDNEKFNSVNFRQKEMKERIRKAIAIIEREEQFGWEANPIPDQCKNCPINQANGGDCDKSINLKI